VAGLYRRVAMQPRVYGRLINVQRELGILGSLQCFKYVAWLSDKNGIWPAKSAATSIHKSLLLNLGYQLVFNRNCW